MKRTKTICLRVTQDQFDSLYNEAIKKNTVVSQLVISKLFGENPTLNLLSIDCIIQQIEKLKLEGKLKRGDTFVLSELFSPSEWGSYFNVIPIGRPFSKLAREEGSRVYELVEWLETSSPPARYKIK